MNTNQRGLYQGGTSGVAQACELQLVNGNLYVYLMEQNNKLVILNVKQFNSCAFQGSSLIVFFWEGTRSNNRDRRRFGYFGLQ